MRQAVLLVVLGILLGVVLMHMLRIEIHMQFNSDLAGLATPRAASAAAAAHGERGESRAAHSPSHSISWVNSTRRKGHRAGKAKEHSRRTEETEESDTKVGKEKVAREKSRRPSGKVLSYKSHKVIFCIPAKVGSSSFMKMVYESLGAGTGEKCSLHDMRCRLEGIADVGHWLKANPDTYSVKMSRDPLQRLVSAWKNKVRCRKCTNGERRDWTFQRYKVVERFFADASKSCSGFRPFVARMEVTKQRQPQWNDHWMPQTLKCSGNYTAVIRLEEVKADSFARFLQALGARFVPYPNPNPLGGVSRPRNGTVPWVDVDGKRLPNASFGIDKALTSSSLRMRDYKQVVERIYHLYERDYHELGYHQDKDADAAFLMRTFANYEPGCF